MSIQVKRRREAASFLSTFTGAQAELIVDTTNNRVQVHDGVTAGGWPAAKLAEVVTNARTAVSDANYAALASDRSVAYTAITAARTVTLPASSAYPTGTTLLVFDESGSCSATNTITISAGSDTIGGASSAVISMAYGFLALQSNGAGKWTIVDQTTSNLAAVGIGTAADPNNPLSVYAASVLLNSGGDARFTINKAAAGDTASVLYQDGFSGRAEIGLCGDDNFHFKVSNNGSTWNTGLLIDPTTGALTPGNARTAVSDAAYSALATDRLIGYTALTAARVVSLPAASAYPAGVPLVVVDESGACSATNTITISRAGSDTINGAASAALASAYAYAALESNGSNAWILIDAQINSANIADATATGRSLVTAASASAARSTLGAAANGANSDITSLSGLTTPLSVAQGGTGDATLTAHGILIGEGTSGVAATAAMTGGQLLVGQGSTSDPAPKTLSGDAALTSSGAVTVSTFSGGKTIARTANLQTFTSSGTYTPTAGMTFCDVYLCGAGGGGGGGCLEAVSTACSGGAGGGGGAFVTGRFSAAKVGSSQTVAIGGAGTAGAAASANTTAGGGGGLGGNSSFGSLLYAYGGGGGAGGQLNATASGGGGGGGLSGAASGSGATGGGSGFGGTSGGSGAASSAANNYASATGGGGCSATGVAAASGFAGSAATGGGAAGGLTSSNGTNSGAAGGGSLNSGVTIAGGSGGGAGANGGAGTAPGSGAPFQAAGAGGGGGGSATSGTAGHGGAGGAPGGGGGGGGSSQNGGAAGAGGAGGPAICYVVEFF